MTNFSKFAATLVSATMGLALLGAAAPANAASLKAGVLTCAVDGGWGYVLGSSKDLRCTFSPVNGPVEHYEGSLSKVGLDLGYTRGGVMIWEVLAPSTHPGAGALQGAYAGATLSASAGVGAGAHVLVGGFQRSVSLQPVSISGESGLNVAAGIGAIHLRHVG